MRTALILTLMTFLLGASDLHGQVEHPEASGEAELLAEQWLEHLNALDDWYLTFEGQEEGIADPIDRMMELYASDVIANVPPLHDDDQHGPMRLRGSDQLRTYFDRFARSYTRLQYLHRRQTGPGFEGYKLVYATPLPWGGTGFSFEILGAYSLREDRSVRFWGPGAVYLQLGADGKIVRMRLLLGELDRVVAQ